MKSTLFSCLLLGMLLLSGATHAEGNCPEGYYPIGGESGQAGPQGCAPIPGYNQQGQQQAPQSPPPQWETRWGAIATDSIKGVLGAVTSMPSKSEAQRAAMADCRSKGGAPCKPDIAYDNECVAMAVGEKGYNVDAAASLDQATQLALKTCSANTTSCHVYYSACSLPQRIQ